MVWHSPIPNRQIPNSIHNGKLQVGGTTLKQTQNYTGESTLKSSCPPNRLPSAFAAVAAIYGNAVASLMRTCTVRNLQLGS